MRTSIEAVCELIGRDGQPDGCEPHSRVDFVFLSHLEERTLEGVFLVGDSGASCDSSVSLLAVCSAEEASQVAHTLHPQGMLVVGEDRSEGAIFDDPIVLDVPELAVATTDLSKAQVFELAADAFQRLWRWDERMLEEIVRDGSVQGVVDVASEMLVNPIAVFDQNLALVARTRELPEKTTGTIWESVLKTDSSPVEYFTNGEIREIRRRHEESSWPHLFYPSRDSGSTQLQCGIRFQGELLGSMGLVDLLGPITAGQISLADQVAERVGQSMGSGSRGKEDSGSLALSRLLLGLEVGESAVIALMGSHGWHPDDQFRILLCPNVGPAEDMATRYFRERLRRVLPGSAIVWNEGDCIAVVDMAVGKMSQEDGSEMAELVKSVCQSFVIGEPFSDIRLASQALSQCRLVARAGAAKGLSGPMRLADVFGELLFDALSGESDCPDLCDSRILRLASEGYKDNVEKGKELVGDLYVYLACGRNAHRAAARLFMHRNTLAYRMGILEDQLGCQLESLDEWQVVYFEISCIVALAAS